MNLLTPTLRQHARARLTVATVHAIAMYLLAISMLAAAILLGGRILLERNFRTIVEQSSLVLRNYEGTFREIRQANDLLRAFDRIQRDDIPWSAAVAAIAAATPPDIRVTELRLDPPQSQLTIRGRAATRDALLALRDRLRALAFLPEDTDVPLTDLVRKEDIEFAITTRLDARAVGQMAVPSTAASP